MAALETDPFVFNGNVTSDKSIRMNSEVYRAIELALIHQMLQNSLHGASRC